MLPYRNVLVKGVPLIVALASTILLLDFLVTPLSRGGYLKLDVFLLSITLMPTLTIIVLHSVFKRKFSRIILCLTIAFAYYTVFSELNSYNTISYAVVVLMVLISQPLIENFGNGKTRVQSGKLGFTIMFLEHFILIVLFIAFTLSIGVVAGGVLRVLAVDIPKPYYYITHTIASSRLGIIASVGVVAIAIAWIIRGASSLATLYLDIDRGEAISIVKTEAYREYLKLKDPLPLPLHYLVQLSYVLFLSSLIWSFTYTLALMSAPRILGEYPGLMYLGFILISYLSYKLISVLIRQIPILELEYSHVLYGLLGILVISLVTLVLKGNLLHVLISSVTGLEYGEDPLRSFILYFEQYILQAQNSFKEFEEGLEVLIKMLWG